VTTTVGRPSGLPGVHAGEHTYSEDRVAATPGFRSARVTRGVESPSRFVLLIEWDSLEAHTVGFRESENFARWRSVVGPFFDGAPRVEHFGDVLTR
jgi:heme-degrading monooxygenase HmoA